jgi:uncharacterized protein (TIGR00730 family)
MQTERWICVYCGSSDGLRPEYRTAAAELGAAMARAGIGLVYGGARVGLMGAVADAVLAGGGRVVGWIPHQLAKREVAHTGLTELHVVDSMHERKHGMAARADAFLALPGGYGTLDELCEILGWAQLGLHAKPVVLLNQNGYYDPLLAMLDRAVAEGFLKPQNRSAAQAVATVDEALRKIESAWAAQAESR